MSYSLVNKVKMLCDKLVLFFYFKAIKICFVVVVTKPEYLLWDMIYGVDIESTVFIIHYTIDYRQEIQNQIFCCIYMIIYILTFSMQVWRLIDNHIF